MVIWNEHIDKRKKVSVVFWYWTTIMKNTEPDKLKNGVIITNQNFRDKIFNLSLYEHPMVFVNDLSI